MTLRSLVLRRLRAPLSWAWLLTAACAGSLATDPGGPLSPTRLRYQLDARWPIFFCDPDYYPIARGDELQRAIEVYPAIAADTEKLDAILEHLALPPLAAPSDSTKLRIYRESKRLASITLSAAGDRFAFQLREQEAKGSVFSITGRIDRFGTISGVGRTPSYGGCPICLDGEARIATPGGAVPVRRLAAGDTVWTLGPSGRRIAVEVLRVGHVPVPAAHRMVRLGLSDGRTLLVSPGHPTAGGRPVGELAPGDTLDGARVATAERLSPRGGSTYDILPAGPSGIYWANVIPLRSTLAAGAEAMAVPRGR